MFGIINSSSLQKLKDLKETLDKYCTVILGCLWTISTLWDIVTFQCFWSDYMLELYSCFFIIFMILQILFLQKVPPFIPKYFGIITTTFGRGLIMIIFSLIFLSDKHLFHKLCTIFLLLGGICLLFLGLIGNDREKNNMKYYPSENNTSQDLRNTTSNEEVPETKIDDSTPRNESIDSNQ
jgi:hypothetical protein